MCFVLSNNLARKWLIAVGQPAPSPWQCCWEATLKHNLHHNQSGEQRTEHRHLYGSAAVYTIQGKADGVNIDVTNHTS